MSVSAPPTILVIDDQIDDAKALQRSIGAAAKVRIRTPDAITKTDLRDADLILVDFELDEHDAGAAPLTEPPNGLALSAVVREQIRDLGGRGVTGVALYTGQVDQISGTIPDEVRGFAVARLTNLEWIFEKQDKDAYKGAVSLAASVKSLPKTWPPDPAAANTELQKFLDLDSDAPYFDAAKEDIDACHPPIHELSNASHALAIVRWMAQRILPYPAFLTDQIGLAARLRLRPKDLTTLLAGDSKLATALADIAYTGSLCELYQLHWWRAGIDNLIFEWSGGSGELGPLRASLEKLVGKRLKFLDGDVVPVIGPNYRASQLASIETAVRLRLDDWPVFADDAWASREVVAESGRLRGLVVPSDLALIAQE